MEFVAAKGAVGWVVQYGDLIVRGVADKRTAARLVGILNKDDEARSCAELIRQHLSARSKLWHLAAGNVVEGKVRELNPQERAVDTLYDLAKRAMGDA